MKNKQIISFFLMALIIVLLTACGKTSTKKSSQIEIVTTTDFYGEVAKAVVGNKGNVTAVINSSKIDPHDFEPTTNTAKQVDSANLVIMNGLGYDSWMKQLIKVQDTKSINVGVDVLHKKTGANPHIWYDPIVMSKLSVKVAQELAIKYPNLKNYFEKNAAAYNNKLKPMQETVNEIRKKYEANSEKKVFVSEPVFDYSISALGFEIGNPEFEAAIEKETDPSPKEIEAMRSTIKKRDVLFFVVNEQVDNPVISELVNLAEKNSIPILKVTETLPEGKTYISWLSETYKKLNEILEADKEQQ